VLVYGPGKMATFSRLMLERHKIVVVVVAYPATSLTTGRVRFCLSSAHTKADLDQLLRACDDM
jgi:serine palmitoyltransferase